MIFKQVYRFIVFCIVLVLSFNYTLAWTPQNNINLLNYYSIENATNINADNMTANNFVGNYSGSFIIGENVNMNEYSIYNGTDLNITNVNAGNEGTWNVNSSNSTTFWLNANSLDVLWFYILNGRFTFNETKHNNSVDNKISTYNTTITSYINAQDILFNNSMKTYVDTQDSFYNESIINYTNNTFIMLTNEGNLNVNYSNSTTFWDGINSQSQISGLIDSQITSVGWSSINDSTYPATCPADSYVTQIGDTSTCTGISDYYLFNSGDVGYGDYIFEGNVSIKQSLSGNIDASNITSGTINSTRIADDYLKNDGDIGNGDYTFNGNTIFTGNITIIGDYVNATVENQYLNGSFLPNLNGLFDLGSSLRLWKDAFFNGTVYASTLNGNIDASNITSGTINSTRIADDYLKNDGDTATGDYTFGSNGFFFDDSESRIGVGTNTPIASININTGTGTLTNGLGFGNNIISADGIYPSGNSEVSIIIDNSYNYRFSTNAVQFGNDNTYPAIRSEIASSTNPNIIPANNDTDTGIGKAGTNILSLIAGAIEGIRITISEVFIYQNLNMTDNNVTDVNCMYFDGGNICGGCINFDGAGSICGS